MTKLGVNIDHVATVRQLRHTRYPDPLAAALLAERGGADQITVHLREDRRHIQEADLRLLRRSVQTELNLEMAVADEIVSLALEIGPNSVTLVPERRRELTTEGGLDVRAARKKLKELIPTFQRKGIRVSLFVDPDRETIELCRELRADAVEIHTGKYADARLPEQPAELDRVREAASLARMLDLWVAAGHGLNYENCGPIAQIPEIRELNIGHAIVARALFVGIEEAVREMKKLIS